MNYNDCKSFYIPKELQHIRNSLPDTVKIQRVEERLSALGNVVACNDYVALVNPDLDRVMFATELCSVNFNLVKTKKEDIMESVFFLLTSIGKAWWYVRDFVKQPLFKFMRIWLLVFRKLKKFWQMFLRWRYFVKLLLAMF